MKFHALMGRSTSYLSDLYIIATVVALQRTDRRDTFGLFDQNMYFVFIAHHREAFST